MDPTKVNEILATVTRLEAAGITALANGAQILANLTAVLKANDPATLDAIHAQALALANSLAPQGAAPIV